MKIVRSFAAVALLTTAAICVSAQQKPAQPRPTTPAAPPATAPQNTAPVAVPDSKMAMIYSDAFLDPKNGIARFNSLLGTLNREFEPRRTEALVAAHERGEDRHRGLYLLLMLELWHREYVDGRARGARA